MNLLIFIHSLSSGGAERVTANLANHWAAKGWQITIVTLAPEKNDFYKLSPAVKRIFLDLEGQSRTLFSGMVNNIRRILALRRVLREVRPDAALSMMTTANILLALAAWGLPNMTAIGSERIHPPMAPLGRLWERLRSWSYGKLDAIVALTKDSAAWLRQNTRARRIVVIPNAVPWPFPVQEPILDPAQFLPQEKQIVLAVGRLEPQKGFDMLIEAFGDITAKHPNWLLVILGEGPQRAALEAKIARLGLNNRVMLPGRVGNIGQWYEAADLYVMSSRFEGFPNTLVEAMAHGLAPVSFDCDTGPRDIIRHGVNGLLIENQNAKKLAEAMKKLMDDEELRLGLGKEAAKVKEKYAMEKIIDEWEKLFQIIKRR